MPHGSHIKSCQQPSHNGIHPSSCSRFQSLLTAFTTRSHVRLWCSAETRPFNEGAAQVRKLLQRDRQELMGLEEVGEKLNTEFGEEPTALEVEAPESVSKSRVAEYDGPAAFAPGPGITFGALLVVC